MGRAGPKVHASRQVSAGVLGRAGGTHILARRGTPMKDIINTLISATTIPTTATERLLALAATAGEAVKAIEDVVADLYSAHTVEEGACAQSLERAIAPLKAALAANTTTVESGDDFEPADKDGRLDARTFDRTIAPVEDTTTTHIGAWLEATRAAEADEAERAAENEEDRELLLRQIFAGLSSAMREAAVAASVDSRELAEALTDSPSAYADGAGLVGAAEAGFTDALAAIRRLAAEHRQPSSSAAAIAAGKALLAEAIMAAFNAATDAVGAIGVALAATIPAIAPDLTVSGFVKDPEKFIKPLVDIRQRLLAAREVSRALKSTDEVLPGYLTPHLATHCGEDATGSIFVDSETFEPIASGELARQMLGELEYERLTPDPAWAIPGCRYYTGITRCLGSGILGRVGVVPLTRLEDEDEVSLVPVHGDADRLEVHYLDLAGTTGPLTGEVTRVVGPEQGKEVVYTAFPGTPVAPSTIVASEFPEREMTAGELRARLGADRAGKVTVKLV